MPRPRKYKDNAAKQKAYRERKKRGAVSDRSTNDRITDRVMQSYARAEGA